MKLSVIKYKPHETTLYNPTAFQKNEDLIIFPFKEFDKFYNETIQSLNVVKQIIEEALDPESTSNPKMKLEHVNNWVDLIRDDMDLLIKYDVQTKLNSFNSVKKKSTEADVQKEEIQCLIGL